MAKTFTSFNRSLSNGDLLLEEEYDAKNDETFGASDSSFEDWEQQHEQFAEIEESSKLSEQIENSLSKLLVLDETDSIPKNGEDSIWSVKTLNGETVGSTLLSSLQRKAASSYNTSSGSSDKRDLINRLDKALGSHTSAPKKICTLEELESTLLKEKPGQSKQQSALPPTNVSRPGGVLPMPSYMSTPQQKPYYVPRLPPGLPPVPPQPPHMPPMGHPGSLPPGLMRLVPPPPHFLQGGRAPHPPPGLIFPPNPQFPVNHPYNFPPPPRMGLQNNMHMNRNHHQHLQQQQQRQRYDSGGYGRQKSSSVASSSDQNVDEYAGLMTNREKQWLLNIQMLQLNTGTPYFDDYYYTVYKSRKANNNNTKRTGQFDRNDRGYHNNRNQHRDNRNNERQDNMLTPRVYTPQQFENSLGKLQCGSVTAPRKIIDMDIVTPDKDSDNAAPPRDTRRSKQILLELEAFYTLFLKAVDLKNPMAINDMEKLREMKQKQRLKELEAAPTPEQKQEILKLLQQESVPVVEDQRDYLVKIVNGLLQDDKFASYFNYSKGKMLVLRLLPYLTTDAFFKVQLKELGFKILLSIPAVMKRDALGDNILPRFYPFWKSQTQTYVMSDVIKLTTTLTEALGLDSVRSTPISQTRQRPKPRLHYVLSNKFGVSALSALVMRVEALMSSEGEVSETQHRDWCAFFKIIIETLSTVKEMQTPIESVPHPIFTKHIERFDTIPTENKMLLLRLFVDRDHNAPIS